MTFNHKLSLITIKIGTGDGVTAEDLEGATVKVTGLIPTATYNLADDTFTYGEVSSDAIDFYLEADGTIAQAIIIPKGTQTPTLTFELKSGKIETATLSSTDFVSGKKYSYTANFGKTGLVISSNSITDWAAGNVETPLF